MSLSLFLSLSLYLSPNLLTTVCFIGFRMSLTFNFFLFVFCGFCWVFIFEVYEEIKQILKKKFRHTLTRRQKILGCLMEPMSRRLLRNVVSCADMFLPLRPVLSIPLFNECSVVWRTICSTRVLIRRVYISTRILSHSTFGPPLKQRWQHSGQDWISSADEAVEEKQAADE